MKDEENCIQVVFPPLWATELADWLAGQGHFLVPIPNGRDEDDNLIFDNPDDLPTYGIMDRPMEDKKGARE